MMFLIVIYVNFENVILGACFFCKLYRHGVDWCVRSNRLRIYSELRHNLWLWGGV